MELVKVFLICAFYLHQGLVFTSAYDECSSMAFVTRESNNCIGILGVLNQTAGHTHDDVCKAYNEVARCFQLKAADINGECTLDAFHATFTKMEGYRGDKWLSDMNTHTCNLTQFTGSICSSPERIGHVSSLGCMPPILGGFAKASHSSYLCSAVSGLQACTGSFLHMLGEHSCSTSEIRNGLQSETTATWIHNHYPSLNLEECFAVYHAGNTGHDSECRDFTYISRHAGQALGVVFMNNVTVVGNQVYCQTFYYGLHQLQHEMEKLGHVCEINDLFHELSTILGYQGVNKSILSTCNSVVMRTTTSDFCNDQSMVFRIVAHDPFCAPYIRNIVRHPSKCMYREQFFGCAETKLHYSGFDCDVKTIFSVSKLTQYFKTNYPSVALPDC